jgi:hypothetical protein
MNHRFARVERKKHDGFRKSAAHRFRVKLTDVKAAFSIGALAFEGNP